MNLAQLVSVAIGASTALFVFTFGLAARFEDLTDLLARRGLLFRSFVSMKVVMPVFAVGMATLLDLEPAVKLTLVALALSPIPLMVRRRQRGAVGTPSYAVALLATMSALAIVVAPAAIAILARVFDRAISVPPGDVARVVLFRVIAPLILGMVAARLAPDLGRRVAAPIGALAWALLVLALVPVLVSQWSRIVGVVGDGTLFALALFTFVGVAAGHLLGGPDPDDRTALAIASGTRHPGVALAIAAATYPAQTNVLAVVLWHLVVSAVVSGPYAKWSRVRAARRQVVERPAGS
jgi:BASS family bile acid:Na+ symporter